jgi:hypothetical protein
MNTMKDVPSAELPKAGKPEEYDLVIRGGCSRCDRDSTGRDCGVRRPWGT